jgi:2-polyprenyl-3-methyl-5-hydroxy-6-metoxy-1,4-benzoquinol methylase
MGKKIKKKLLMKIDGKERIKENHPYLVIGTGQSGNDLISRILDISNNSICFHQKTRTTYEWIIEAYQYGENSESSVSIINNLKSEIAKVSKSGLTYGESSNHLFFVPSIDSFNAQFEPKYILAICEPVSFVKSALARGFYDPDHPYPLLNPLLPGTDDPIKPIWRKLDPFLKCLWYWMAKNDYALINLVEKIPFDRWRVFLFENINEMAAYQQMYNFLGLDGFNANKSKIRFLLDPKFDATSVKNERDMLSTKPKPILNPSFEIDNLKPEIKEIFFRLAESSLTNQLFYNDRENKCNLTKYFPKVNKQISDIILGKFSDSVPPNLIDRKKRSSNIKNGDDKKPVLIKGNDGLFNEEKFKTAKERGLLGERDTPLNPEFIKSGYAEVMRERYEMCISFCQNKTVLDVGCGLGWGSELLSNYATEIFSIDYDPEVIKYCEEKLLQRNIHFKTMRCEEIDFDDEFFDIALLMELIEHLTLENGDKCIKKISEVLKPNGVMIGSTYIPENDALRQDHILHSDNEFHYHIYTFSEMQKLLSKYFLNYKIIGTKYFFASDPIYHNMQCKEI